MTDSKYIKKQTFSFSSPLKADQVISSFKTDKSLGWEEMGYSL
ncbi:MAG: hypothetical protein OXJ52_08760 [Oligoflexia bacterium]|nr:hypothetical protein [Oligoflexia bacterium]